MDRINVGNNRAANTLANAISADLAAGRQVNVVGYSQGGATVSHALDMVNQRLSGQERERTLSNVNVVGIAGAGRNFPAGPQYSFYVNRQDPVPNLLGVHEPNRVTDTFTNTVTGALPWMVPINGGRAGYNAPGARIFTFDDRAQGGFSSHNLDTYFAHIPSR